MADTKSSATDMVTAADREPRLDRRGDHSSRPTDGFMGEEGTDRTGTSGVRWIIDPIDGTTNFVFSIPAMACRSLQNSTATSWPAPSPTQSTASCSRQRVGAELSATASHQRAGTTELPLSLVATGFSVHAERRRRQAEALTIVLPEIADIRRMGSAAIDLCSVGLGRVDAYYEIGLNNWDLARGRPDRRRGRSAS